MTTDITQPLPSIAKLIKATVLALLVASVILISIVLPAEYGIDPTGIGKKLGLTALNASQSEAKVVTLVNETVECQTACNTFQISGGNSVQ